MRDIIYDMGYIYSAVLFFAGLFVGMFLMCIAVVIAPQKTVSTDESIQYEEQISDAIEAPSIQTQ